MQGRRTVRDFSDKPIPPAIIQQCIQAAATASSGANLQPWHFVVVTDPQIKRQIRLAAEQEDREFYATRAPKEWLDALTPLGTDEQKPFLEIAALSDRHIRRALWDFAGRATSEALLCDGVSRHSHRDTH